MLKEDDVLSLIAEAESACFYFKNQHPENKIAAEVHSEIRAALEKFYAMSFSFDAETTRKAREFWGFHDTVSDPDVWSFLHLLKQDADAAIKYIRESNLSWKTCW